VNLSPIFDEIQAERQHQVERWGVEKDLEVTAPVGWIAYIAHHATRWQMGGFAPYDRATLTTFRNQMVKVATLAIAAIQATDAILEGKVSRPDVLA
jgi:hypothetical protein